MVWGVRTQTVHRLQALRSYMDDVTTLPLNTRRLLRRLDEHQVRMKTKPAKSDSLSVQTGDNIFWHGEGLHWWSLRQTHGFLCHDVYQAAKQKKHFWEVTARQGQAWAGTSSQDVVPNHKEGEERVGDLRSNQNWGQDIQGHSCKLMTREVDKLGRSHQRSHNGGRPCKEIEIPNQVYIQL